VSKDEALRFYDGQGSWTFIPLPHAIAHRMGEIYQARQCAVVWDRCRDEALHGARAYQIDAVVDQHWRPALAEIEAQIAAEGSRGVLRIVRREEVLGV
jgi:hypothetical protein